MVGTQRSAADLKVALLFSILGVVPHLIYTLAVFFSVEYIGLYKALLVGCVGWLVAAAILVLAWQHLHVEG